MHLDRDPVRVAARENAAAAAAAAAAAGNVPVPVPPTAQVPDVPVVANPVPFRADLWRPRTNNIVETRLRINTFDFNNPNLNSFQRQYVVFDMLLYLHQNRWAWRDGFGPSGDEILRPWMREMDIVSYNLAYDANGHSNPRFRPNQGLIMALTLDLRNGPARD